MKVGDYVRTKDGLIGEIYFINLDKTALSFEFYNGIRKSTSTRVKSSPNIIDLIEVGDVITFGYVYTQTKEVKNIKVHRIKNEADLTLQKFYFNYKKRTLKSIVTKEQFESMEYKIGE